MDAEQQQVICHSEPLHVGDMFMWKRVGEGGDIHRTQHQFSDGGRYVYSRLSTRDCYVVFESILEPPDRYILIDGNDQPGCVLEVIPVVDGDTEAAVDILYSAKQQYARRKRERPQLTGVSHGLNPIRS